MIIDTGFPDSSVGKESTCNAGDLGLIPGLGRSPGLGRFPWRKERLPTPVFWPGEFHRWYSPWGPKESDMTEWLSPSVFILYIQSWVITCVYWRWLEEAIQLYEAFIILTPSMRSVLMFLALMLHYVLIFLNCTGTGLISRSVSLAF